jgi:alpha-beta hydrolase superfamily lysophospholipase
METDLRFSGSTGAELSGVLHRPAAAPRGAILLAHCFSCSKDHKAMSRLASGLEDAGFAVLRFDFTGLGDSEGEFGASNLANGVGDVVAAADQLADAVDAPLGLLGHSLGGSACLLAAPELARARSVVTLNAPASPSHLRRHLPDVEEELRTAGQARIELAGRPFTVQQGFLDDLEDHDQRGAVAQLGRPLLVLHALDDGLVAVADGERIFAAASQPKAFHPLLAADHLLTSRRAAEQALAIVVGWFDATLRAGGRGA